MNITWTKDQKQIIKLSKPLAIDIGIAPERTTDNNGTTITRHIWVEFRVFGYGIDFDYWGDKRGFKFNSFYSRYNTPFFNKKRRKK